MFHRPGNKRTPRKQSAEIDVPVVIGGRLTRDKAKAIIEKTYQLPEAVAVSFATDYDKVFCSAQTTFENAYAALRSIGLALGYTFERNRQDFPGVCRTSVTLSDAANKYLITEGGGYKYFRACEIHLDKITGIREGGWVETTFVLRNSTPFSGFPTGWFLCDPKFFCGPPNMNRVVEAGFSFGLWDDGWRIEKSTQSLTELWSYY